MLYKYLSRLTSRRGSGRSAQGGPHFISREAGTRYCSQRLIVQRAREQRVRVSALREGFLLSAGACADLDQISMKAALAAECRISRSGGAATTGVATNDPERTLGAA